MINRYCPNCSHVLILELQIDDKKMKSRLHQFCEECGFDINVDPFHSKYREAMMEFVTIICKENKFKP